MSEISITFLQHRRDYIDLFIHFINKIKPENRKLLSINFMMTDNLDLSYLETDVPYKLMYFSGRKPTNNYRSKMWAMLEEDCKYTVKFDEDIIMSNHVWDYMIENREILYEDPSIVALTPVVNIGVPTCDMFIDDFCSEEDKNTLNKMFVSQDMAKTAGDRWNVEEYGFLNKHTLEADVWNPEAYWKAVGKLKAVLKGIHPVRVDFEAQKMLGDIVTNNIPSFLEKRDYSIDTTWRPYLCNDTCMARTDVYRDIEDAHAFAPYDEIPLNLYRQEKGLRFGFIRNGLALHTLYGYVSTGYEDRLEMENEIYRSIKTHVQNTL
jgi:hypothetical protein